MLKLVKSNPEPNHNFHTQSEEMAQPNERAPFVSEVLLKGRNLYILRAQDLSHYLECDLILEIEEGQYENESNFVVCHFPQIEDEQMSKFIGEDETLYYTILLEFQMKVFKQLLMFCATHYAAALTIYSDDTQTDNLAIYRDVLNFENQVLVQNEDPTEIIIPLNQYTVDVFANFMDQVTLELQQTLWKDQRANSAIRYYLKSHPFGKVSGVSNSGRRLT